MNKAPDAPCRLRAPLSKNECGKDSPIGSGSSARACARARASCPSALPAAIT
eukprot:NODE_25073_length_600_cov_4.630021.p3 GENE.NODE_25073_length_600_cov_4.630021~~NODE_25073_length_600_cov_4.630021.p3  ORF type:complete len:52 (+),score=4.18 NODE_25073_length_600_cov_4.630021:327-482(+)